MDVSWGAESRQRMEVGIAEYNGAVMGVAHYNGVQIYGGGDAIVDGMVKLVPLGGYRMEAYWANAMSQMGALAVSGDRYMELDVNGVGYGIGKARAGRQALKVDAKGNVQAPGSVKVGQVLRVRVKMPVRKFQRTAMGSSSMGSYALPPLPGALAITVVPWPGAYLPWVQVLFGSTMVANVAVLYNGVTNVGWLDGARVFAINCWAPPSTSAGCVYAMAAFEVEIDVRVAEPS